MGSVCACGGRDPFHFSFLPFCVVLPTACLYIYIYIHTYYNLLLVMIISVLWFSYLFPPLLPPAPTPPPTYLFILGSVFSFCVVRSFAWSVVLRVFLFLVTGWRPCWDFFFLSPHGICLHCRNHQCFTFFAMGGGGGGGSKHWRSENNTTSFLLNQMGHWFLSEPVARQWR